MEGREEELGLKATPQCRGPERPPCEAPGRTWTRPQAGTAPAQGPARERG